MSTGSVSARDSSASRREASEMSLISRSRRCTSSRMMVISFFCCTGSSMRATVSTALRSDVSRSEEHTSELPVTNAHLVCRLLLEKKTTNKYNSHTTHHN